MLTICPPLLEDDPAEEEREEGDPVLSDGLWSVRYRYVTPKPYPLEKHLRWLTFSLRRSDNLRQYPVR